MNWTVSRGKSERLESCGSGAILYPCPAGSSPRRLAEVLQHAVRRACEGWPQELALVSVRPAPNTQECARLFCPSHVHQQVARIVEDEQEKIKLSRK